MCVSVITTNTPSINTKINRRKTMNHSRFHFIHVSDTTEQTTPTHALLWSHPAPTCITDSYLPKHFFLPKQTQQR